MSEITKLYENAGVEPKRTDECKLADEYWNDEELANKYGTFDRYLQSWCPQNQECTDECKWAYDKFTFPPFTAEKQLELIKWLVKHRFNFMVYELTEKDFTFEVINKRLKQTSQFVSLSENNFEEGLAKFLNCFWQDLSEEEKQQVKGILK